MYKLIQNSTCQVEKTKPPFKRELFNHQDAALSGPQHILLGRPKQRNPNVVMTEVQPKQFIGAVNDKYEKEADRVAEHVMRMPITAHASTTLSHSSPAIQRKCQTCDEEEVQRKTEHGESQTGINTDRVSQALSAAGQPLDKATRAFFEPRFGYDFSQVRIHSDNIADQASRSIQARAFTVGSSIAFQRGEYSPNTFSGRKLLAHELTHVVQQQGGASTSKQSRQAASDPSMAIENTAPLSISRFPKKIMRVSWASSMQAGQMPACGTPQFSVFPSETAELGDIPSGARSNCRYTPLFRVPQFRLPDGRHRVTVRAHVHPIPVACREGDWSINVYECFENGSRLADGCVSDRGSSYAGGSIANPLEVTYPRPGAQGLWSTRNLSVRVSNGCSTPIPVSLRVVYPNMPEPTAWEQVSEGIHMMLDLLGLTEPFGVFFDGVNAIIYAAEGEWLQAGLSAGAAIPIAGAGIVTLRRIRRGGEDVIGMTIRREALPLLRSEDVTAALRRARENRGGRGAVPDTPRQPPSSGGGGRPHAPDQQSMRRQIEMSGESFRIGSETHRIGTFYDIVPMFGICSDCGSLTSRLNDLIELLPQRSAARREAQELMGRVRDADRRLQRGALGRSGGLDPSLETPLLRAFMADLGNIAHRSPEATQFLTMPRNRMGVLARTQRVSRVLDTLRQARGASSLRSLGFLANGNMQITGNRLVLHVTMIQGRTNLTTLFRTAREIAREAGLNSLVISGRPIGQAWAARLAERFSGVRQGRMSSYTFTID